MNTTLSPVTVQGYLALQGERIALVEQDYTGLTPKLEQIIRAFEFTQIELAVYRERGYAQGRGVGQPEADRCALACAFLAKAVLGLLTTRALMERLQADSKLRRLCGFDLRFALPSEATFSRVFAEFSASELMQRVPARMIEDTLGKHLIGHISRDSTALEARESIAKKDKAEVAPAKLKNKRGRPQKSEVRPTPEPSPLERQRSQTLAQILAEIDTACATGTKKSAQGYEAKHFCDTIFYFVSPRTLHANLTAFAPGHRNPDCELWLARRTHQIGRDRTQHRGIPGKKCTAVVPANLRGSDGRGGRSVRRRQIQRWRGGPGATPTEAAAAESHSQ